MKSFFKVQNRIVIAVGLMVGIPVGVGGYTFHYAEGWSYFSSNPKACMNCHIMGSHFESWSRSSHHTVAACNDCHASGNIFRKYAIKASNGYWHSWAFTTGRFKEPIEIKPHNREIVRESCLNCHKSFVESSHSQQRIETLDCLRCHANVGHWR